MMVRAARVTNPLSRALGAGIAIGGVSAALFLMTDIGVAKEGYAHATLRQAVSSTAGR
ncbi:hypothetical protein [Sphingomonas sp. CFBP 8760]|uniref:hypothetical protein n=1 Tax=Sphingomonas sp. CFBP 8760 TaxID=2775282 RepID=UPI00177C747C|nr:hypothetical protein [Sphingomonas sp. CFBP 8760]MBD8547450.1 hypothetical protein [Sphingomonas sp. CFBP 8760]